MKLFIACLLIYQMGLEWYFYVGAAVLFAVEMFLHLKEHDGLHDKLEVIEKRAT